MLSAAVIIGLALILAGVARVQDLDADETLNALMGGPWKVKPAPPSALADISFEQITKSVIHGGLRERQLPDRKADHCLGRDRWAPHQGENHGVL